MNANSFEGLSPSGQSYARLPLLHAFNWAECLAHEPARQWYVVAFRSIRSATADPAYLKMLDDLAYEEARREPGLLWYFRGTMTEQRECLSICVWEGQPQAQAATRLAAHQAAADITDDMYDLFEMERWLLIKHESTSQLELRPAPTHAAQSPLRRRTAVPLGTSRFVDLNEVAMIVPLPLSQELGYSQ